MVTLSKLYQETRDELLKALRFTANSKPATDKVVVIKRILGFICDRQKFILLIWRHLKEKTRFLFPQSIFSTVLFHSNLLETLGNV